MSGFERHRERPDWMNGVIGKNNTDLNAGVKFPDIEHGICFIGRVVSIKRAGRTIEWLLAVAWPIVAYQEVFKRYGWKSEYYNQWGEIWFAFALLVPMVGPLVVGLFSASMEVQKRAALIGLMTVGVGLAIMFRPDFGGLSVMGFFIPIGLHALGVFLWLGWRSKKPLSAKQETEGGSDWRDAA